MMHSNGSLPVRGGTRLAHPPSPAIPLRLLGPTTGARAFTLLEVALIVAIIGMMMLMLLGYVFAPHKPAVLPPVAKPTPIPSSTNSATPAPRKAAPATPSAAAPAPEPTAPAAPATPAATPAPTQTIELSPQSIPIFR